MSTYLVVGPCGLVEGSLETRCGMWKEISAVMVDTPQIIKASRAFYSLLNTVFDGLQDDPAGVVQTAVVQDLAGTGNGGEKA